MKKDNLSAITLKYPENADLPFISAKAKGVLAEKLIKIAKENNVPIVKNDIAANILSLQEIGDAIPEETWEIVAKIFAVVVESNKKL